eukprot:CAMPEP_0184692582 /NCGR_PEP_ID=MMETSP0313-20130426/1004_1 /TAXON_ID=2792 /ORGANISM="Porphyridium aerugineum, Strain SAG 1380-2" /LENGTH=637 /DNA_ID=CAMNT_0027150423 /DNA_START=111 /DNA_END=2024 /DNA_ORIENTATION=-
MDQVEEAASLEVSQAGEAIGEKGIPSQREQLRVNSRLGIYTDTSSLPVPDEDAIQDALNHTLSRSDISKEINPFSNKSLDTLTTQDYVSMAMGAVLLLPLRLVGLGILMGVMNVITGVATVGIVPRRKRRLESGENKSGNGDYKHKKTDDPTPDTVADTGTARKTTMVGWRRKVINVGRALLPLFLQCLGVTEIDIKGQLSSPKEAPIVVVAPHSTPLDIFAITYAVFGSFVSAAHNAKFPVIGGALAALECVLVERDGRDSKKAALNEICRRAEEATQPSSTLPHLILFPEGTTTNRQALLKFKAGAFVPGKPVQPVLIRYKFRKVDLSWVDQSPPFKDLFFAHMCSLGCKMQIEFLDVVHPLPDEVKNPDKYAERVRVIMSQKLGIPTSHFAVEDMLLQRVAIKNGLPADSGMIEYQYIKDKLQVSMEDTSRLLKEFSEIDKDRDGMITLEEFANFLGLPVTDRIQRIFRMYDIKGRGKIQFREYIIGMLIFTSPVIKDDLLRQAFSFLDLDKSGTIYRTEFIPLISMLLMRAGCEPKEAENLASQIYDYALKVAQVDAGKNASAAAPSASTISTPAVSSESTAATSTSTSTVTTQPVNNPDPGVTYDDFQAVIKKKPQYANLLQMVMSPDNRTL